MESVYYSDKVKGPRARDVEEITPGVWRGLIAYLRTALAANSFAESFPEPCQDGGAVAGTDEQAFWMAFEGDLPDLPRKALGRDEPPDTFAALDMVEFLHLHASEAKQGAHHGFYRHHHLEFDPEHSRYWGRDKLCVAINRLFSRNGLVYEITSGGIVRNSPQVALGGQLRAGWRPTTDVDLDELLERARRKYLDKDPAVRREALEAAWDAFERIKTVLDTDKKRGSSQLIAAVSASRAEAEVVESEMRALTGIGNDFRIRHHETNKAPVRDEMVEPLFARIYALLHLLHGGVTRAP